MATTISPALLRDLSFKEVYPKNFYYWSGKTSRIFKPSESTCFALIFLLLFVSRQKVKNFFSEPGTINHSLRLVPPYFQPLASVNTHKAEHSAFGVHIYHEAGSCLSPPNPISTFPSFRVYVRGPFRRRSFRRNLIFFVTFLYQDKKVRVKMSNNLIITLYKRHLLSCKDNLMSCKRNLLRHNYSLT